MATEGIGAVAARELGHGWKISPCITIPPSATVTLADIAGPGAIQQMWFTVFPKFWRNLILRIYWDGEETPSVEVPLGDFFCNGWCTRTNVTSLPVAVNPAGGFNCYWEMPFRRHARITVENLIPDAIEGFFYQINYTLTEVEEDRAYFHAQFRRQNPLPYREVYTILDNVAGQGHFVGVYMAWGVNNNLWWGEGEVKFYIDGDGEFPTICGTGTEDYFGGAWGFEMPPGQYGVFSSPFSGMPQVIKPDGLNMRQHPVWPLPLACHGSHPLQAGSARDDPGARLAHGAGRQAALPGAAGRHRLHGLLVPVGAACPISHPAGFRIFGSDLTSNRSSTEERQDDCL